MNKVLWVTILLLCALPLKTFAGEWRQDFNYYTANKIWLGDELKDFNDLDGTVSNPDAKVVTFSTRATLLLKLSDATTFEPFVEMASSKMDGFSAGGAKDGDKQTELSRVGLDFSTNIKHGDFYAVNLEYGFEAPGSEFDALRFNAVGGGTTVYNLGASYSYHSNSSFGFYSNFIYKYVPAKLERKASGVVYGLDIPDRISIDLGVPYHLSESVVSLGLSHEQSLSGIDIMSSEWTNFASNTGDIPFSATREIITTVQLSWAKYIGDHLVDVALAGQVNGRNTDKGLGINFAYTMEL